MNCIAGTRYMRPTPLPLDLNRLAKIRGRAKKNILNDDIFAADRQRSNPNLIQTRQILWPKQSLRGCGDR
jgi:hypothetical protein